MKKTALCVMGALVFAFSAQGQGVTTVSTKSAAEGLYEQACAIRESGDPRGAIELAATGVARYSQDKEWIAKTEWLCAELYMELNMLDAADVTARQITLLYPDTEFDKNAQALRIKIEELKKQSK